MKVSVLVTFYNQEDYVDEALQSVFDQKCDFDFEVLIGDDGSTDGTMAKLQKWKQKYPDRMEIYVMDRELGVKYNSSQRASRNRLNLLQYVKGEYFAYLDGDDFYIDDHKLQKQVEIMDQPENAKYAVCAHNVYAYDEKTKENIPFLNCNHTMKLKGTTYWGRFYFHPDSILMRSAYIKDIPMDVVADYFNDNTITFCFIKHGDVYYMPDIMASYRQTGDGIWTGNSRFINYLRNLMDYDLEQKIAPEFIRYSLVRHRADMSFMHKCKEQPAGEKVAFYEEKIKKDGLTVSEAWLEYCKTGKMSDKKALKLYRKAMLWYFVCHVKWLFIDSLLLHN